MAHTGLSILRGIERGEEAEVSARLDQWRKERFELASAPAEDSSALSPSDLIPMKEHLAVIRAAEARVQGWLTAREGAASGQLASAEGARVLADRILPLAWEPRLCLLVMIGTGGEQLSAELVRRGHERLVVVLPENAPAETHPPAVRVVRSASELNTAVRMIPGPPVPGHASFRLPSALAAWTAEECAALTAEVPEIVARRQVMMNTLMRFGGAWIQQGVQNLPAMAHWPSLASVGERFAGKPCVIVSPGPSLEKNIRQLAAWEGKAVILAVNRSAMALHRAGIIPDAVITADPSDLRYHFEGVPVEQVGALLMGATSHPGMFQLPGARYLTYPSNGPVEQWLYQKLGGWVDVNTGGSVACSAFSVATRWGCDPIILVGQDLAFAGERFYAAETPDAAYVVDTTGDRTFVGRGMSEAMRRLQPAGAAEAPTQRFEVVKGYHGGEVRTTVSMHMFRRWFEYQAVELAGRVRLLNCTEGGAYIEGMEHVPLAEALARHGGETVDAKAALSEAARSADVQARSAALHAEVKGMVAALDRCVELSRSCIRLADKAADKPRAMAELGTTEKQLTTALQAVLFLSVMVQGDIIAAQEEGQRATTTYASLAASKRLFRAILDAAPKLRPAMVEARDALAAQAAG